MLASLDGDGEGAAAAGAAGAAVVAVPLLVVTGAATLLIVAVSPVVPRLNSWFSSAANEVAKAGEAMVSLAVLAAACDMKVKA